MLETVDAHAGLPARIVVGGLPNLVGKGKEASSALELRDIMRREYDHLRSVILQEPRGMATQNVDFIFPPTANCPEAKFSLVIGEHHGIYPLSSGHNTICAVTALLESGMVEMHEPVTEFVLEAPGGPLQISARCTGGKAESVTFRNMASFVPSDGLDLTIDVPCGVGPVTVDVAWGGMWYAIVDAGEMGLDLLPQNEDEIVRLGEMIRLQRVSSILSRTLTLTTLVQISWHFEGLRRKILEPMQRMPWS